jgi:hypothetical protein
MNERIELWLSRRQLAQFQRMAGNLPQCHRREFGYLVGLLLRNCELCSDQDVERALDTALKHTMETTK